MRSPTGIAAVALLIGAAGGLLLGSGGCGQSTPPAAGSVRGTVTFQGRPLAGGLIVFAPNPEKGTTGRPASATIGPDGWYSLESPSGGLVPGWYRVAIADAPTSVSEDLGLPRFPAPLRRPDRSGLEREVRASQDNLFHFAIEIPE